MLWVGALQIMLDKGKDLDWFNSGQIVTLAVVAVVGFVIFLVWELTDEHPVVDLRLFARRNFWTSTVAMSLAYGLFFGNVVLLPLWLQQYMGYTATWAGMVLAPVGVLAILLTPLVGRNITKVDPRMFATVAFVIFALVLFMRSHFNTDADLGTLMIPTIIQGAAMAVFFIPLITLALSGLSPSAFRRRRDCSTSRASPRARSAPRSRRRSGTAARPCITRSWSSASPRTTRRRRRRSPTCRRAGLTEPQSLERINRLIDEQAFMLSANDIFYVSAILFVAADRRGLAGASGQGQRRRRRCRCGALTPGYNRAASSGL